MAKFETHSCSQHEHWVADGDKQFSGDLDVVEV